MTTYGADFTDNASAAPVSDTNHTETVVLDDPLGRRILAALIDIAVLTGLAFIMGLAVGGDGPHTGSVTIRLTVFGATITNWWLLLYFALVLLYFFAWEASSGQTFGKALLGLRVTRLDGTRPSAVAIAERTMLRMVDWLPFGYLVGFIAVVAKGAPRQRLGDLAARTMVTRTRPAQLSTAAARRSWPAAR